MTNSIILVFCGIYSLVCLASSVIFTDFRNAVFNEYVPATKIELNFILMLVTMLQIPFKFFVEKEFLFILYDELKNRGTSRKVLGVQEKYYS
jgi:hypothetical protein